MKLSLISRTFLVTCLLMLSLAASPPIPALAATLTVSNCNDSGGGSLRQAVLDATDGDTIQFSLDCPEGAPITLASAIYINKNLNISGHGQTIAISGNDSTRIFEISSGTTVRIEYLTLVNANGGENENGGAILDDGSHLTVANVTFKNNRLTGSLGDKGGGAIAHRGGSDSSLTIEKSRFEGNSTQNLGGAILTSPPTTITDTTFSGNVAYRGTVTSYSGQALTIERSAFHDNVIIKNTNDFPGVGGAIYFGMGTLQVKNSTFSGNGSDTNAIQGGAIYTYGSANVLIWNSTFTGNKIWDSNGYYKGGGIHITSSSMLSYYNTILAGNSPDDCALEDSAIAQNINNLVQVGSGCGTSLLSDDPQLGPLQDNGGLTHTHAIDALSPALNAGDNDSCTATDQRGVARPQGAACDIGAYEYAPTVLSDYDGDGISDPAKFYPSNGTLWWLASSTSNWGSTWLGNDTYDLVSGSDYDGDGKSDPAKFVSSIGTLWYIQSSDSSWSGEFLGVDEYEFVGRSDFDGDGKTDPAKFVSSIGALWYIQSSSGLWQGVYLGPDSFEYLAGNDFDGDGKSDPAKYVPSVGVLWYYRSTDSTWDGLYLGVGDYDYISGNDYDGDGKSDPTVFYASTGTVWWQNSSTGVWDGVWMGSGTFTFVGGHDFDGDGKTDLAKFDPVTGQLSWLSSSDASWYMFDLGTDGYDLAN